MLTVECFSFNPFSENTYLVYTREGECMIVDPGCYSAEEKKLLKEYIARKNLIPRFIFLTHTHIDHVFGLAEIKKQYEIPISIGVAVYNYWKGGHVNITYALIIAGFFAVGGFLGSRLALSVDQQIVKKVFAVLMVVVAVKMFFGK